MRRPRDIRRNERIEAHSSGYVGGSGIIHMDSWSGRVIWGTDEGGLEHVSVSPFDSDITPSWGDMCIIKDIFWEDEETVIQVHPPKSQYVNLSTNCLHLWRYKDGRVDETWRV